MMSLEGFLEYARIGDPTDPVAGLCYRAALEQARRGGVPQERLDRGDEQAALLVYAYGATMYDNRGGGIDSEDYEKWMNSLRMQLIYG
jgi:hypothetical protein